MAWIGAGTSRAPAVRNRCLNLQNTIPNDDLVQGNVSELLGKECVPGGNDVRPVLLAGDLVTLMR